MSFSLRLGTVRRSPVPSSRAAGRRGSWRGPTRFGRIGSETPTAAPRMAHRVPRSKGWAVLGLVGRVAAAVGAGARQGLPGVGTGPTGRAARPSWLRSGTVAAALLVVVALVVILGRGAGLVPSGEATSSGGATGAAVATADGAHGWPPPPPAGVVLDPLDLGAKLALVGLLLYVALQLLRRFVAPAALRGGPIVVLATRSLGPKSALHLVAIGERRLLVGESPAGLVGLTELTAEELELPMEMEPGPLAAPEGIR